MRDLTSAKIVPIYPPGGIAHPGAYTSYDYVSFSQCSLVNGEVKTCIIRAPLFLNLVSCGRNTTKLNYKLVS